MSRDREEEFPGKIHEPKTSCPSSATSTKYSVTDGRDVELGNCVKIVTVTVYSFRGSNIYHRNNDDVVNCSNSEFKSEIIRIL